MKKLGLQWKIILLFSFAVLGVLFVVYVRKESKKEVGVAELTEVVDDVITPKPTEPAVTITPIEIVDNEGKAKSMLTGLYIEEEHVNKRPFAIMLNNLKLASPQSGTSDAAILYEALVEGGITRFMAIYDSIDEASKAAERLGSVRSARHYFVSFAEEYDAIFIHYGETTYATKKMKSLGTDHIAGTTGIGENAFYRDSSIKSPHNVFATKKGINSVVDRLGFRTEYEEGYESHFSFYDEDTMLSSGDKVNKLTLGFSSYTSPYFIYNENDGVYERYQFGSAHVDANTKETLSYKNILIQFVKEWDIDSNGYQTMELSDTSGEGYYITNGSKVPITWKKNESTGFMRYYDANGNELTINPGKTYIAVFPNSRTEKVVFE